MINIRPVISHQKPSSITESRKGKGLWVASSIGSNIDRIKFSEATNSNITFSKAYTAQYDESAYYPDKNLERIVPDELKGEVHSK